VTIAIDLRNLPRHEFENRVSSWGTSYCAISYNLVVTTKGASLIFSVEIKGKEWGMVEVNYD
jgi:hypothetical protein